MTIKSEALSLDWGDVAEALPRGASRVDIDPDNVARDVSQLVLSLAEFLRQLMEAQAIRRMEAGSLTEEEEERLGQALYEARGQIRKVAAEFGLSEHELRLDLGPLGRVV